MANRLGHPKQYEHERGFANRASELLSGVRGDARKVHPNYHVNRGQSSNDTFQTAMHVAAVLEIEHRLLPALKAFRATLASKSAAFYGIVKISRTHLQDATPLILGQELSGYVAQLGIAEQQIRATLSGLHQLEIGGTAVGIGLKAHPQLGVKVAAELAHSTGSAFVSAPSKFQALASHDALLFAHWALKRAGGKPYENRQRCTLVGQRPPFGAGRNQHSGKRRG